MDVSLEGKVALVSGASRGIGKAIAAEMAASGAQVMINSRKQESLEAARGDMTGEVEIFACNAGDDDAGERAVTATLERFGQLDVLVNNAATNPYYGRTLDVDDARYRKTFQVNLDAPLKWTQAAWTHAFAERPGTIINIASVGGLRTEGVGLGIYNVTKAALIHLTRQLAHELGPTRVIGIAPGLVETDFAQVLVDNFGESLANRMPLKRLGQPEDIAHLTTFLASDMASWITGDTYVIDGGAGVAGSADRAD